MYRLITLDGIESVTEIPPSYRHMFGPVYPYEGWKERAFDLLVDVGIPEDQAIRLQWLWMMVLWNNLDIETQLLPEWVYTWAMVWYHEYRRGLPYIQHTGVGIWGTVPAFWNYRKPRLDQNYQEYAPRTCYIMAFQEDLWMAELLSVDSEGVGYYELCYHIPTPPVAVGRQVREAYERWDRFYWLYVRRREFGSGPEWLVYDWWKWNLKFVGMLVKVGDRIYKLRLPKKDPFLEEIPWTREGGLFGTPEYDGIYRDWWP